MNTNNKSSVSYWICSNCINIIRYHNSQSMYDHHNAMLMLLNYKMPFYRCVFNLCFILTLLFHSLHRYNKTFIIINVWMLLFKYYNSNAVNVYEVYS